MGSEPEWRPSPVELGKSFGEAIYNLKQGKRVYRRGWHTQGMYLELFKPLTKGSRPFVFLTLPEGDIIPWTASQADMLEEDWVIKE